MRRVFESANSLLDKFPGVDAGLLFDTGVSVAAIGGGGAGGSAGVVIGSWESDEPIPPEAISEATEKCNAEVAATMRRRREKRSRHRPPGYKPPVIVAPSHTQDAFDVATLPGIVDRAKRAIEEVRADGILCLGHSGLIVAGALSYVTRVPVIAVRKRGEINVGSTCEVSAVLRKGRAERWVWIDDFFSEGRTLRRAVDLAMREGCLATGVPAAALLYRFSRIKSDTKYHIGKYLAPRSNRDGWDRADEESDVYDAHCPLYGLRD